MLSPVSTTPEQVAANAPLVAIVAVISSVPSEKTTTSPTASLAYSAALIPETSSATAAPPSSVVQNSRPVVPPITAVVWAVPAPLVVAVSAILVVPFQRDSLLTYRYGEFDPFFWSVKLLKVMSRPPSAFTLKTAMVCSELGEVVPLGLPEASVMIGSTSS